MMIKHAVRAALLLAALAATGLEAKQNNQGNNGQGNNRGNSQGNNSGNAQRGQNNDAVIEVDIRLPSVSIGVDRARYLARDNGCGHGKPLPPGIRKNMARGKPIPPGLRYRALPAACIQAFPHYPGYEWRAYGSDLVLVGITSAIIANVIIDALD